MRQRGAGKAGLFRISLAYPADLRFRTIVVSHGERPGGAEPRAHAAAVAALLVHDDVSP